MHRVRVLFPLLEEILHVCSARPGHKRFVQRTRCYPALALRGICFRHQTACLFRVSGFGFRVSGFGSRVCGLGFVPDTKLRACSAEMAGHVGGRPVASGRRSLRKASGTCARVAITCMRPGCTLTGTRPDGRAEKCGARATGSAWRASLRVAAAANLDILPISADKRMGERAPLILAGLGYGTGELPGWRQATHQEQSGQGSTKESSRAGFAVDSSEIRQRREGGEQEREKTKGTYKTASMHAGPSIHERVRARFPTCRSTTEQDRWIRRGVAD
jgi:hypothetical protein